MENKEFQKAERWYFHDRFFEKTFLRIVPDSIYPNQITIFRFAITPLVAFLVFEEYFILGFLAFLLAAFSDALDGSLARTRGQVTEWGKIYDPLADKILIATMIFIIALKTIALWTSILIISLEVIIIIAAWKRKTEGRIIQANGWGKIKMGLQVLGVSVLFLALIFNWAPLVMFASGTFYLAIVFAVVSLLTHGV